MVVWPSITQCEPTLEPAPMRTCGPMMLYGPTVTDGSSRAPGSMMAVGWILAMSTSGNFAHGAHQLGFNGNLFAHQGAGFELEDAGLHAVDGHIQDQLVTRLHRTLEACAIN